MTRLKKRGLHAPVSHSGRKVTHIGITNTPKVTALGGRKNLEAGTIEPVIGNTESTAMNANKTPWT